MSQCSYLGEEVAQHSPAVHLEPVTSCAVVCTCTLTLSGPHYGPDLIPLQTGASCSNLYRRWLMKSQVVFSFKQLLACEKKKKKKKTKRLNWYIEMEKNTEPNRREPRDLTTETECHDCYTVGGWNTPALPPCQSFVWFEELQCGLTESPTASTPHHNLLSDKGFRDEIKTLHTVNVEIWL